MEQQDFSDVFSRMAEIVGRAVANLLPSSVGKLVASIQRTIEAVRGVTAPAGGEGTPAPQATTATASDLLVDAFGRLTRMVEAATDALGLFVPEVEAAEGPRESLVGRQPAQPGRFENGPAGEFNPAAGGAPATEITQAAGGGGLGGLAAVGMALGGFVTAIQAAVGAIQEVIGKVRGFVEALSPATVQAFDRAMRDLSATIGVAFQPVFEVLTGIIRQIAGIIMPVMEQLRPVVEQVTASLGGVLVTVVRSMASGLEALMPVIRVLAVLLDVVGALLKPVIIAFQILGQVTGFLFSALEAVLSPLIEGLKVFSGVMDAVSEVMNVVSIIFKTVTDAVAATLKAIFGVDFKGVMDFFVRAVKDAGAAMVRFVAYLAAAFGQTDFLKKLEENLRPKQGATAALQGVGVSSLEQIAKDMAVASAAAAGVGEQQKGTDDYLRDLAGMVHDIAEGKNVPDWVKWLKDIHDNVDKMVNHPADFIGERAKGAVQGAKSGVGLGIGIGASAAKLLGLG